LTKEDGPLDSLTLRVKSHALHRESKGCAATPVTLFKC